LPIVADHCRSLHALQIVACIADRCRSLQIVACIADRCMHCKSLHALQIVACIADRRGCHDWRSTPIVYTLPRGRGTWRPATVLCSGAAHIGGSTDRREKGGLSHAPFHDGPFLKFLLFTGNELRCENRHEMGKRHFS
jgi:hypothetical protein